eukprot:6108699-Pyramimonas_sp.AAC.1
MGSARPLQRMRRVTRPPRSTRAELRHRAAVTHVSNFTRAKRCAAPLRTAPTNATQRHGRRQLR